MDIPNITNGTGAGIYSQNESHNYPLGLCVSDRGVSIPVIHKKKMVENRCTVDGLPQRTGATA